jgi:hypothetical protein
VPRRWKPVENAAAEDAQLEPDDADASPPASIEPAIRLPIQ